jgi:hypothetical protein
MLGAVPPLPQYDFRMWRSVKKEAPRQIYLCFYIVPFPLPKSLKPKLLMHNTIILRVTGYSFEKRSLTLREEHKFKIFENKKGKA